MMDGCVLHVDANSFYASVEQAEDPKLKGRPVVVAGKEELRHGIVLTKSKEAKDCGIRTAEALWEARKKCPDLIVLPPNYPLYKRYSAMMRTIFYQYSDLVEDFGLDESWIGLTDTLGYHARSGISLAEEISERIKAELGITVSIGVSWNKIISKFGSDYMKPDAITVIDRGNFEDIFWSAPVEELLYVGRATQRKLNSSGHFTIGDLAHTSDYYLQHTFGKIGFMLRAFARGEDDTPVKPFDPESGDAPRSVKGYGNGLTAPHDITCEGDAKALLYLLCESVAQRLREDRMRASTISIAVRDGELLTCFTRQAKLARATASTKVIAETAWKLLVANQKLDADHPVRALSVRASSLESMLAPQQLSLFQDEEAELEELDLAIDELRRRFGNTCIQRGIELMDESLHGVDIKGENTVHPVGFLHS